MAVFEYVARTNTGKLKKGKAKAASPQELSARLRRRGLFLTGTPREINQHASGKRKLSEINILPGRVKRRDIMMFTDQFAAMLEAGMDITECLDVLEKQSSNAKLREVVAQIKADIIEGRSLSQAIGEHPKVFDALYVSMIEAAEASGSYVDVLFDLAKGLDKAESVKRKVKSALQMPIITIGIAIVITLGLIRFAVPQFTSLFNALGGELPLPTRVLIGTSDWLQGWTGAAAFAIMGITAALLRKLTRTGRGKFLWDKIKLKLPIFGTLVLRKSIVSFASTLSLLLRNGVDYLTALEIVKNSAENEIVRGVLAEAQTSINKGSTLSAPITESGLFPPLVCQMIQSGEKAGKVDEMLKKLAMIYEREVDQAVENLSKALEPMLTVILGLLIGGVLMGLYLPVFKTGELITGG